MFASVYLFFDGNCAEAFRFYERLFGAKIGTMQTYAESPAAGHVAAELGGKIIHADLKLGATVLMGSDAPPGRFPGKPQGFSVSLAVETSGEAERIFRGLTDGGKETMAMGKTFFAERFGMCTDRFAIPWMVICDKAP